MSYHNPSYHTPVDTTWLVHRVKETLETNLSKLQSKHILQAVQDWKPWLQLELIHHLSQLADRANTALTGSGRLSSLDVEFISGGDVQKSGAEGPDLPLDLTIRVTVNGEVKECHGIILLCRFGAEKPAGFGKRVGASIEQVKIYDIKHLSTKGETVLSLNVIAVDILDHTPASVEAITEAIGEGVEVTTFEVRKTNDDAKKGSLRIWSYKKETIEEGGQVLLGYATERAVGDLGSGMMSIF
jgi:hypothetical protein